MYYDVTNYDFESDVCDELRRKGVAKSHKKTPIVQLGLFMENNGLPITYRYTLNTPSYDGYVFSMSVREANKEIKDYVLEQKGYVAKGEDFKFKSRLSPRTILVTSNHRKA